MASLSHAALDPSSLAPPQQGGLLRAVGLALVAHALLIAALTWGVSWKSQETPAVEAEIWSSVRQQAAPRAVEPPAVRPEPEPPQPTPEPPPQPKVEPPPAPPKAAPPPDTSVRDAQIALEREKKEREKKERERELAEQRREDQRKAEAEKKRQDQLEAKRDAERKAEAQRKADAQRKAEQQKEEAQERRQAEAAEAKRKQQAAAKAAQAQAQEQAAAEARRQENIRRMQGMAGASGGPTATGSAMQSTGPSASYGARVAARVRPNIVFPDSVQGNPSAEVEVRSAPDGTIVGKRLTKSSGNKAWDDAVLRAIDKTETMPRDTDGRVPSLMTISFRPKDN